MQNPYVLILGFFSAAGLITCLWAWRKISRSRQSLHWTHVAGTVVESRKGTDVDPSPIIIFEYRAEDKTCRYRLPTPDVSDVTPESAKRYLEQYPAGYSTDIFYNPQNPEESTLKPGPAREDWLIFGIGLIAAVFGLLLMSSSR